MKQSIILSVVIVLSSCGRNEPPSQTNANTALPQRTENIGSVAAHTTENQNPPMSNVNSPTKSSWSQSGDPIDTKQFDAAIAAAEKALKTKPSDEAAKKALAEAFFKRGFALTEARQYASAIGDYRRALKHDPAHQESQKWIDQIVLIYGTLKKAYPKEGEEPPPLKMTKQDG